MSTSASSSAEPDYGTVLARNCRKLLDAAAQSVTYEVLRTLCRDLPDKVCHDLLGLERTRVWRARRAPPAARTLGSITGTAVRPRKNATATNVAEDFWKSVCRRSRQIDDVTGERKNIFYLGMRKEEVWVRYVSHCINSLADEREFEFELPDIKFGDISSVEFPEAFYKKHHKEVLKRTAFKRAMPAGVCIERFLESSCPICREGLRAEDHLAKCKDGTPPDYDGDGAVLDVGERAEFNDQVAAWKKAVSDMNVHRVIVAHQRKEQQHQRDNVGMSKRNDTQYPDMLVVFDFSPFSKVYDTRRSLADAMGDTQDLIVTVYYRDKDGETLRCLNVDNFAKESNDHVFFRRVMLNLCSLPIMSRLPNGHKPTWISFWSDGGPKHFKIRRSIFFVCVELKQRLRCKRLTWSFYASHHGKSVNDAHAAVVKRTLWRLAREGLRTEGPRQLADVASNLKNTDAFYFDLFDREEVYNVSKIPGIKASHYFEWRGDKEGSKFVILCAKLNPIGDADDGNLVRIAVEQFYTIDFDDVSGAGMDKTAEEVRAKHKQEAKQKRQQKVDERAAARVAALCKTGAAVAVRFDKDGSKTGEWWLGKVEKHQKRGSKDQIYVKFDVDERARRRGLDETSPEMEDWIDVDTEVRLVQTDHDE